jgi:AraC family transcriptional regulator
MLKTKSVTENLIKPSELSQRLKRIPLLSSQQIGWNGILVEQHEYSSTSGKIEEKELPALSDHWLILPLGHPSHLSQKSDDRLHESLFQKGDSLLVPAKKSTYWRCPSSELALTELNIHIQSELIAKVAKASEMDTERIDLANHFRKQDLQLQHIAMLFLAELQSGGVMGRLYVESLTQALIIHLLRHYSEVAQIVIPENRNLTHIQLQQAIDYIHTHLDRDLSLFQIAKVINISPTYFASLFKSATGTSPHQYVIQQRVEQAKVMLSKTDMAIADIALQVGFSSQSHLTQQFKRLTGVTPRQVRL